MMAPSSLLTRRLFFLAALFPPGILDSLVSAERVVGSPALSIPYEAACKNSRLLTTVVLLLHLYLSVGCCWPRQPAFLATRCSDHKRRDRCLGPDENSCPLDI